MRWIGSAAVIATAGLALFSDARLTAQAVAPALAAQTRVAIAARSAAELADAASRIDAMIASGELVAADVHDDTLVAGRRFETLRQVYRGVPVEGGSVTRQMTGAAAVSITGTVFTGIDLDPIPALRPAEAAQIAESLSRRDLVAGTTPVLVVHPTPTGVFLLAYRATTQDAMACWIDAQTGAVIERRSVIRDDVGVGTGVLGDRKKMATTVVSGSYRTIDRLRPASLTTLDTRGSELVLDRLLNGQVLDADIPTDADNVWADGRTVDAHVNTGWSYDYFFRRFGWNGSDGTGRAVYDVIHRGLRNNAFFVPPPFGPIGGGVTVYGDTTAGVPVASLDIIGHEMMHGVTDASLRRRTGDGLRDVLFLEGTGTTSFTFNGQTFSCVDTVLQYADGRRPPFWCSGGRFVLAADHPGALNEGFSDIFGTSIEFFFQTPGTGPLRADYQMGEDIPVFGPNRSLVTPGAITITTDSGAIPYPDHRTHTLAYAMVILAGTQERPTIIDLAPVAFVNGVPFTMFSRGSIDGGAVHLNSTLISHAFYLAIEGGRNATSGLNVTGVGAQNREQIERIFFRAMRDLMPPVPSFEDAANVVYQSAVDLYGANSPAAQAVRQALTAVGLPPQ